LNGNRILIIYGFMPVFAFEFAKNTNLEIDLYKMHLLIIQLSSDIKAVFNVFFYGFSIKNE